MKCPNSDKTDERAFAESTRSQHVTRHSQARELERPRNKKPVSIREITREHIKIFVAKAIQVGVPYDQAQDVVQDVLLRILRAESDLDCCLMAAMPKRIITRRIDIYRSDSSREGREMAFINQGSFGEVGLDYHSPDVLLEHKDDLVFAEKTAEQLSNLLRAVMKLNIQNFVCTQSTGPKEVYEDLVACGEIDGTKVDYHQFRNLLYKGRIALRDLSQGD